MKVVVDTQIRIKYFWVMLVFLIMLLAPISSAEPSDWALGYIERGLSQDLFPNELLADYQQFITREEYANLSLKLYETLTGSTENITIENPFTDTNAETVIKAYQLGIVSGVGEGKFDPTQRITREQMATMFYNTLNAISPELVSERYSINFADADQISSWAQNAVALLTEKDIIAGMGNNLFSPKTNASREQAMVLSLKLFEVYDDFDVNRVELRPSEISKRVSPSVVYIEAFDENGDILGSGSGFNVDTSGHIFTNYHVIEGAYKLTIRFIDGKVYEAHHVMDFDVNRDVALLSLETNDLPIALLGNSSLLINGEEIFTIGSPIGLENTIADGLISNGSRVIDGLNYLQISAPISPGSSGGALVNLYGEVVGITTAQFVNGQNINLAIPINEVKQYMRTDRNLSLMELASMKIVGKLVYDDGSYYEGEIQNGLPEGSGTLVYVNGDRYEGTFKAGEKSGIGEYHWANEDYYIGAFEFDTLHGMGTYYYADGITFTGVWAYDEIVENLEVPTPYVRAKSETEIEIGWKDNQLGWYYRVYYAYSETGPWFYFEDAYGYPRNLVWSGTYSANLYDLSPGTTVYFRLTSYIFDLESKPSNTVHTTTLK